MATIEIMRVSLTLTLHIDMEQLKQEMGELVAAIGPNLARQVQAYVKSEQLGYYPALDFFSGRTGIDPNLLSASEHVASLVCDYARYQIKLQLREPFSNIQFEKIESLAFSMPRVLPSDTEALQKLSLHYSPNVIRAAISTSSVEKSDSNKEGYERRATHKARHWLEDKFESVEINNARIT